MIYEILTVFTFSHAFISRSELRFVMTEATRHMPPERVTLDVVGQKLQGYLDTNLT